MDQNKDAPPCPLCKAVTKLHLGNFRPFYGCTRWQRNDPKSCPGKVKLKPSKALLEAVLDSVDVEVPWRWIDLTRIDMMSGSEFERYIACLLIQAGFRPIVIGGSGDRGADIVLRAPNGDLWVIQVKRWRQRVDSPTIIKTIGARELYRARHAVVITNQGFTKEARDIGLQEGVELWGRGDLAEAIRVLEYATELRAHKASM